VDLFAYGISRSIGQYSMRAAGHGRVALACASLALINDIIHLGMADAVQYAYSNKNYLQN
jgi:hypothetical protein